MRLQLKPSYETEIYVSDTGYLCIRQINALDDTQIVMLSPQQAQVLNREMLDLMVEQEEIWSEEAGEGE